MSTAREDNLDKYMRICNDQCDCLSFDSRNLRPASAIIYSSLQNVSRTQFSRSSVFAQSQKAEHGITETPSSQISCSENAQSLALLLPFSSWRYFYFTSHREMSAMIKFDPFGIQKSISSLDFTNYSTNLFRKFYSFLAQSTVQVSEGSEIFKRDFAMATSTTLQQQKTLYVCTDRTDCMIFLLPIAHPDLTPVAAKILPPEYTLTVLSYISGSQMILGSRVPSSSSKIMPSQTLSQMMTILGCFLTMAAILLSYSCVNTLPTGLCGEFMRITFVLQLILLSKSSKSTNHSSYSVDFISFVTCIRFYIYNLFCFFRGLSGRPTALPPAIWIWDRQQSQAGSKNMAQSPGFNSPMKQQKRAYDPPLLVTIQFSGSILWGWQDFS